MVKEGKKNIAVLFPGQGAQYVGMGKSLAEKYTAVKDIFQNADEILGFGLSSLIFNGPEEELTLTKNSQPAIYVMSWAAYNVLRENIPNLKVAYFAGLSLGEYTAYTAAGVFGFEDGTVIVNNAAQTVNVILVGVNDISSSSFSIYPNPSNGVFNLTTTAVMGYESNITVYDLSGKLVYNGKLEGNEVNVIDLSAQEKGMYIMQIIVEDKVYNKTLVIQ